MTFCASVGAGAGISVTCHWQCHWYHVMLVSVALLDQRNNIAPHFNCLDIWNVIVPLMMLLASCDTHASFNVFKWPKSLVPSHFNFLDLGNAVLQLTTLLEQCQWCHINQKKVMLHLILIIYIKEFHKAIGKFLSILWCWYQCNSRTWHQCQWHHVMSVLVPMESHEKVILHLISIVST